MAVATEMPKELQACETCGHEPDPAKRYAWLAGCPDGHKVYQFFEIAWLADRFAHLWPDSTYSAISLDESRLVVDYEAIVLAWLDACHAGKTSRHERDLVAELIFDPVVSEHHVDPATGDVTITWSWPERG